MSTAATTHKMSYLDIISRLGLQNYHETLVSHGFGTWDLLVDISEGDMAELGFELGHRRKLQRAIADFRGQPHHQALFLSSTDSSSQSGGSPSSVYAGLNGKGAEELITLKRKYRRRLPKDPHAPRRPNSGYVLFANFLRQNPLVSILPFIEIAKIVGDKWQHLLPREKAVWMSCAAEEKSNYGRELEEYQQTEDYKSYQDRRHRRSEQHDGRLSEDTSSATAKCHSEESSIQMSPIPSQEQALSPGNSFTCNVSAQSSITNSIQTIFSHQQSKHFLGFVDPNIDSRALQIRNGADEPRSLHVEALNPFRMISGIEIWPLLDCFIQRVNSCYYCVNAESLLQEFCLAVDTAVSLTVHTMYTLCLCISIGCQFHDTGSAEMAIMWYENGRRYLDSEDWGCSLDVMRALTLISIFHRSERPTTARHYLDVALRIGEANNLSLDIDRVAAIEGDTPGNDWILVWRTIQTMASIRPADPATC